MTFSTTGENARNCDGDHTLVDRMCSIAYTYSEFMTQVVTMTPGKTLEVFFASYPEERFRRGKSILSKEHEPKGVFFLKKGYIRQYAKRSDKEELNVHIYRPGAVIPLMWLFNETTNRYCYDALSECVIHTAPRGEFSSFLAKHPELVAYLTERVLLGLSGLLSRMESLVLDDAYTKTVLLFLYFSQAFGEKVGKEIIIDIPVTHRQVASWIGTARETASLQVEKLRKQGLLGYRKSRYIIPDIKMLQQTAQNEKDKAFGNIQSPRSYSRSQQTQ
jgi:CRP/FNR family transcriptional regulator, cyclic AMP receptor protein